MPGPSAFADRVLFFLKKVSDRGTDPFLPESSVSSARRREEGLELRRCCPVRQDGPPETTIRRHVLLKSTAGLGILPAHRFHTR